MSYDEWRFTFGAKTKTQIDAISQSYLLPGLSVWNTDIKKPEYVNLNVETGYKSFVNEDCVTLINNTGVVLSVGQIVRIGASNITNGCILATTATDDFLCGVVYRGADTNRPVVIAIQGEYYVKIYTGEVTLPTIGNIIKVSTTPGEGDMTAIQTGTINNIGVCGETLAAYPGNRLVKCMIQNFQSI